MNTYIREPINGLTHLAGAVLSFIGLLALVIKASLTTGSAIAIMSVAVFGISMLLLYSASASYHMVIARNSVISYLRKIDHAMIFFTHCGFLYSLLFNYTSWVEGLGVIFSNYVYCYCWNFI